MSLFSGLNNLKDITLDSTLLRHLRLHGATDLDTVFAPELPGPGPGQAIRDWYNGYGWLGEEKVYNPFDILLLFRQAASSIRVVVRDRYSGIPGRNAVQAAG